MPDPRVLVVIALLGIGAVLSKALDLWAWHKDQQPIIDTQTNGGVRTTTAWSGTSATR